MSSDWCFTRPRQQQRCILVTSTIVMLIEALRNLAEGQRVMPPTMS